MKRSRRRGSGYLVVHNLIVHLLDILRVEGREPSEHLVHERAERPPVDSLAVRLALKNLGGEVLGGTTERHSLVVLCCESLFGYLLVMSNIIKRWIAMDLRCGRGWVWGSGHGIHQSQSYKYVHPLSIKCFLV